MFAVSKTIYKAAEGFYFARNEFWFYDLVVFEAFATKELHRELVIRIVLFYGTLGRASATAFERASKNLIELRNLSVLRLHIDPSAICSKDFTETIKDSWGTVSPKLEKYRNKGHLRFRCRVLSRY
jgi:hypothetical protein